MNAGRDVERLIADWLIEEAPARAPDRILDAAGRVVDDTKQRRFTAAWREPMIVTTSRLVAAAVLVIAAVLGAGLVGRSTASVASPGQSTPSASASASTRATYSAARAVVCQRYTVEADSLKSQLADIYKADLPAAQRVAKIDALDQIRGITVAEIADLQSLDPPADIAADHAASIARMEDNLSLIVQELALLRNGDLAGAKAVDLGTDPISRQIEAFERTYGLARCP